MDKYTYSNGFLKQKATMEKPKFKKGYDAFDRALNYKIATQEYESHLASLQSFQVADKTKWIEGKEYGREEFELKERCLGLTGDFCFTEAHPIEGKEIKQEDAVKNFKRAINALALELPEPVWNDFHYRWIQFQQAINFPQCAAQPNAGNPYAEICDKLGNPIDALDSYLQLMNDKKTHQWGKCNELIEKIKTIFHEFRNKPNAGKQDVDLLAKRFAASQENMWSNFYALENGFKAGYAAASPNAVEFAEWCARYYEDANSHVDYPAKWKSFLTSEYFTTEQLYQKYKDEK